MKPKKFELCEQKEKPSREYLEKLYRDSTNKECYTELKVSHTTMLRWLDFYEIPRKGSPQQQRGIGYREILSNWWLYDGTWSRVNDYNGQYLFQGNWVSQGFFLNLRCLKFPKEIK